jgi:hypothetical protein
MDQILENNMQLLVSCRAEDACSLRNFVTEMRTAVFRLAKVILILSTSRTAITNVRTVLFKVQEKSDISHSQGFLPYLIEPSNSYRASMLMTFRSEFKTTRSCVSSCPSFFTNGSR